MENNQIAHDLAITMLSGSDLDIPVLIEKYHDNYKKILSELNSTKAESTPAKIINSPISRRSR